MFGNRIRMRMGLPCLNFIRQFSVNKGPGSTDKTQFEKKLIDVLKARFTEANEIHVIDVSGGCGAMFDVTVISPEFKNISLVKQHRMVNDALKDEIKQMHGLRISTYHEPISNDRS